jgi:hypothetical protein
MGVVAAIGVFALVIWIVAARISRVLRGGR